MTIWLLACFCNSFLFILILWFFPGLFLFASKSTVSSWKNPPTAGLQHQPLWAKVGNPPHAITRLAFRYEGVLVGTLGIISFLSAGLGTEWLVVAGWCGVCWMWVIWMATPWMRAGANSTRNLSSAIPRSSHAPKNGFHVLWCRIGTLSYFGYASKILDCLPITDVWNTFHWCLPFSLPQKQIFILMAQQLLLPLHRLDGVGLLYLTHHR